MQARYLSLCCVLDSAILVMRLQRSADPIDYARLRTDALTTTQVTRKEGEI